jgi:hypothetical protein
VLDLKAHQLGVEVQVIPDFLVEAGTLQSVQDLIVEDCEDSQFAITHPSLLGHRSYEFLNSRLSIQGQAAQ